jgi:hypothetical protein
MVKESIAYYTTDRTPLSLSDLTLHKDCFLEDIFDSVEDAQDFDQLTTYLKRVIAQPFEVDRVKDRYIRYKVYDPFGNMDYLKIKIKRLL